MLNKLLKHEFKATGRIMLPLVAAIVLLSAMSGFAVRVMDNPDTGTFGNFISSIILMLYFVAMFSVGIVALVLMVERFKNNLLGSEGYLMFTLPVGVDAQIFAKLIVSVVWLAVSCLVLFTMFILLSLADFNFLPQFVGGFDGLASAISEGFRYVGSGSTAVGVLHCIAWFLECLLMAIFAAASICLHFYAALAIGHSFSNRKMLWSVVAFFGISMLLNILGYALLAIFGNAANSVFDAIGIELFNNGSFYASGTHLMMLLPILYTLVLCVIYYFPTRWFLKNKLNLA